MNVKILIVLTMVLCAFCVFSVNAAQINLERPPQNNYEVDIGKTINLTVYGESAGYASGYGYTYDQHLDLGKMYSFGSYFTLSPDYNEVRVYYIGQDNPNPTSRSYYYYVTVYYEYGIAIGNTTYDINVDESENIINLGTLSNLKDISFSVGSESGQLYYISGTPLTNNCSYIGSDVYPNEYYNIIVDLDENSNYAEISLNAECDYGSTSTTAKIYYEYLKPAEKIQFEIECIDYDKGIQLIGTNLTVYYYNEDSNTLQYLYSNSYANGLTKITVDRNRDLFIEYNLNGYNAVNIDTFDFLGNRQGKIINSDFYSARLYFSKIDPSVLLFQGFIIKDSNLNALSGVSVTMDNNVTLISNSYGGVRFDNINQGSHTFTFSKAGYYSQSLTKTVSISNTQDIMLISSGTLPTTQPTVKPTPFPTDSAGNIIIDKPSNLADSIKYGLAKIFGVNNVDSINLIFAMLIILFPAVVAGVITNQALAFIAGGLIGFVFALALGLIPIWVFFSMVMLSAIYLVMTHSTDGF